jgi:hypothetical protein
VLRLGSGSEEIWMGCEGDSSEISTNHGRTHDGRCSGLADGQSPAARVLRATGRLETHSGIVVLRHGVMRHAGHVFVVALLGLANATGVRTRRHDDRRKGGDEREHQNKSGCQAIHGIRNRVESPTALPIDEDRISYTERLCKSAGIGAV